MLLPVPPCLTLILSAHSKTPLPGAEKAEAEQCGFFWCSLEKGRAAQILQSSRLFKGINTHCFRGNYLHTLTFACA